MSYFQMKFLCIIFLRNNDKQTIESTDFYSFDSVGEHYQDQQVFLHGGLQLTSNLFPFKGSKG